MVEYEFRNNKAGNNDYVIHRHGGQGEVAVKVAVLDVQDQTDQGRKQFKLELLTTGKKSESIEFVFDRKQQPRRLIVYSLRGTEATIMLPAQVYCKIRVW